MNPDVRALLLVWAKGLRETAELGGYAHVIQKLKDFEAALKVFAPEDGKPEPADEDDAYKRYFSPTTAPRAVKYPLQEVVPYPSSDECKESIRVSGPADRVCPYIGSGVVLDREELASFCHCFAATLKHFP